MATLRNNMRIVHNSELPTGTYRIICIKCRKKYYEGIGSLTQSVLDSMNYPIICDVCKAEVVLEENCEIKPNKYDADHPYPYK